MLRPTHALPPYAELWFGKALPAERFCLTGRQQDTRMALALVAFPALCTQWWSVFHASPVGVVDTVTLTAGLLSGWFGLKLLLDIPRYSVAGMYTLGALGCLLTSGGERQLAAATRVLWAPLLHSLGFPLA